jgi:hypothetical protein
MFDPYKVKLSRSDYKKVDVYAFGILMYEIISGQVPYFERNFNDMYELRRFVTEGGRPCIDSNWSHTLVTIMIDCWSVNSTERPSFTAIVQTLQRMMNGNMNDQSLVNWYRSNKSQYEIPSQNQPITNAPPVQSNRSATSDSELKRKIQQIKNVTQIDADVTIADLLGAFNGDVNQVINHLFS